MAIILGISAFFHDSSACIIVDGEVIGAALEERFTRKKHDSNFPEIAIKFCLEEANLISTEIDEVVFFEKPFTKFERILDSSFYAAPKGYLSFKKAVLSWLKTKFWIEDVFRKQFPFNGTFSYCQHHLSHAANAAFNSPFNDAAYLVVDGVGEKACTSYGTFSNNQISPLEEQQYPHSIGLLYSAFTQYCGFKVNSGEYKLMGLAPYGKPKYATLIIEEFVSIDDNGVVKLKLRQFGFLDELRMVNKRFEKKLGASARKPNEPMSQFYKDIAASIQKVTEDLLLKLINVVQHKTSKTKLVFGGGVALNCVANAFINKQSKFNEIYIHSASGDGGCAMGAALWRANQLNEDITKKNTEYIGPSYSDNQIKTALKSFKNVVYQKYPKNDLITHVAQELASNKVVGWFQGRMEFGPRALGNRSILASPKHAEMKQTLNLKIKKREGFRPFAPIVLNAHFNEFFENENADYSRMLYTTKALKKDIIPSCVHEDNTSRVQSLSNEFNPTLHSLLEIFHAKSGIPVLINTSFNERGEPIVCSPMDALNCFFNTDMDILAIGNYLVSKADNLHINLDTKQYALD